MDNKTTLAFKRAFRDVNHSLQQINAELFKLSLKQFSLEKTLIEKGVLGKDDSVNSLTESLNTSGLSDNLENTKSTLEALAQMAKRTEKEVKVINN